MRVEITFDDAAVTAGGYRKEDVTQTVSSAFGKRGLPCVQEDGVLSFEDTGRENDYAHLWNVIKGLMISDWFLSCASSCVFVDDDGAEEDVLAQAYLFKKRTAV